MAVFKAWLGMVILAAASIGGDQLCRRADRHVDREMLLTRASTAIDKLPRTIGKWSVKRSQPLPNDVIQILQCRNHLCRHYVHEQTGEEVELILLVGGSGRMLAHTPEICYASANFDIADGPESEVIRRPNGREDTFNTVLFKANDLNAWEQRVYYGWCPADGKWQAPKNPRWNLGGEPMLYKLQIASVSSDGKTSKDTPRESSAYRFVVDSLPYLDGIIVSQSDLKTL